MMHGKLQTKLLAIILLAASTSAQAGGGWVKAKGKGYYKLGQTWVKNDGYFGRDGMYVPTLSSTLLTTSFYTEYGLGSGISLEAYIPLYMHHSIEGRIPGETLDNETITDETGGIGDVRLGLRTKLLKKDHLAISGSFTLGIPLGSAGLGERENLFTGDDEFDQSLRVDISAPFGGNKVGGYGNVYAGFNNRAEPFSKEFTYGVEVGLSALESRLWLIGRLVAVEALNDNDPVGSGNSFTTSASFTNYMVETAFSVSKNYGISASYTGSVSGELLLVAPVVGLGVYMDIK